MRRFLSVLIWSLVLFNNALDAKILGAGKIVAADKTQSNYLSSPAVKLPDSFTIVTDPGAAAEGIVNFPKNGSYTGSNGTNVTSMNGQVNLANSTIITSSTTKFSGVVVGGPGTLSLTPGTNAEMNGNITTPVAVTSGATITASGPTKIGDNNPLLSTPGASCTLAAAGQSLTLGVLSNGKVASTKILMCNMCDLNFKSKIVLTGEWTFTGDANVAGNGNILDISLGGTIRVHPNTSLSISDMKIRGLGIGKILLDDPTAQIRTSFIEIEMNRNYTFTTGSIYAEGPTNIVTKNDILRFSQAGALTVDGIALTYDTTTFTDQQNIRPFGQTAGPNITTLNNGIIRLINSGLVSQNSNSLAACCTNNSNAIVWLDRQLQTIDHGPLDIDINQTTTSLSFDIWLSREHRMFVNVDSTLDGHGHFIHFSHDGFDLLNIADGKTFVLKNVVLKGLTQDDIGLGANSHIIFDNGTLVSIYTDPDLNVTWTFKGQTILNGAGEELKLQSQGNIFVTGTGSSLLFDNILISGVAGNNIRCMDDSCTLSFYNTTWILDDNYSFTTGKLDVLSTFDLVGSHTFQYATKARSIIEQNATLLLDIGSIFYYAPSSNNRDLLSMFDGTSRLYMNGATLASTTTGLRLTNGTLIIDKQNFLRNDGAVSLSQGISFGNGLSINDLSVDIIPGSNIKLLSGILDYRNSN